MTTLFELQKEIEARMRYGESFSTIEDEVIEPSPLSEMEKAALWLYGWSFVHRRAQRRMARAHIALLDTEPRFRRVRGAPAESR